MSFLIHCPNCGDRGVTEYRFGGEANKRPLPEDSNDSWLAYIYRRGNRKGIQTEWWYHRYGCRQWLLVNRDTDTNEVIETGWPELAGGGPTPMWRGTRWNR
ncbi:MAG: sarcosine oxidase subunit delta [SAR202 cluster bacterium]|nr:sarcosine oxidase subunit delta [SAR202 cluster bacterium]